VNNIWSIYKKELRLIFSTWIGYVVVAVYIALTGYFFYDMISQFVRISSQFMGQKQMQSFPYNINEHLVRYWLANSAVILLFVIPLLTMRIFSEEKKTGTIETLMTAPIKDYQIVFGKYFAVLTVILPMLFSSFLMINYLSLLSGEMVSFEWGPIWAGFLGLILLGGAYIAIGVFISSITENQIISSLATFGVLLILWVVGWTTVYSGSGFAEILRRLALNNHYDNFAKGVISASDTLYFLIFIVFFLLLTGRSLETARWKGIK